MPEPLDPEKYHIMTARTKKLLLIFTFVLVVLVIPLLSYFYYTFAIGRPAQFDKDVDFTISNGESVSEISAELYKHGVIRSDFLFNLYVKANRFDKNIQAGDYKLKPGVSVKDLVAIFQHGVSDRRITFLEGWRVEEFAREASTLYPNIDFTDFVKKAKIHEGRLFPDTYYFREDVTEEEVIKKLTETFDDKTKELFTDENIAKSGLTKDQILIFASIVEREISNPEDRPVVSGILIKRWQEGMKIDADATTQYAIADSKLCGTAIGGVCTVLPEVINRFNWWEQELTQEDLLCESQFNTRKYVGLPPAPISSPGLSAIEATLNHRESPYYYYLSDPQGVTRFATTLEEHDTNVAKYLVY